MIIKRGRRILLFLPLLLIIAALVPHGTYADTIYWTNTKDSNGHLIWTQPAYVPEGIVGDSLFVQDEQGEMKFSPMQSPKDLFIDDQDHIYVADTGNNRIVEFGSDGGWLRYITVPESPLNKPEGIFVAKDQTIYVADTGNKRVVHLDQEGKLLKEFTRPVSPLIPESFKFDPIKLIVDKRGFLYIATLGGYQGLLQLDQEGQFQSFYGANRTVFSPLDAFKRFFYTKEMYANEISKLPGSISSVAVDQEGFVYTTTVEQGASNQIKKLNIRGLDMLESKDTYTVRGTAGVFGEMRPEDFKYIPGEGMLTPRLIDLCIDSNGNITAIDATFRYINQYDASGNLLFFWAGPSSSTKTQLGLMKNPVAIDANSLNDLYVLDGQENTIQIFRLSEFGSKVNEANRLTLEGRYEESEKPWREVLRMNANFNTAMLGLGKAAYKSGDYQEAMALFKRGGNHKGFSEAFWQTRLIWFQKHFSLMASLILGVGIAALIGEKYSRHAGWRIRWNHRTRSDKPLLIRLKHIFYLLRHPIDGFSAIRYEAKGSYLLALIVLILVYVSLVMKSLYTGYTFNMIILHRFNLVTLLLQFALIWFGWVVSNYLVSSIYKGEGRFKDVFIGSAYALVPFILVGIPLSVLSNAMTNSEQAIYDFLLLSVYVWSGLLFFWMIQSLQNYSVGETFMNIVLSLAAFMTLAFIVLVTLGLSSDLKDFIYEVYQEVRLR
ncbi:YIP1 family protein [Paenibacillus eucommiae]|uniref:DNA-binding beta-propeller fold protein YncE n=1 Tax=Paenibacillus eucommiae TaxID=1355755 RepID=A0ABS4JC83_9BACL|nr:YIP1 family protein [Paenibacillus eucommiae]MBP1996841.1 DNA-binding beta-propeller fold protein YncE [Paenibacillus eucommiae]